MFVVSNYRSECTDFDKKVYKKIHSTFERARTTYEQQILNLQQKLRLSEANTKEAQTQIDTLIEQKEELEGDLSEQKEDFEYQLQEQKEKFEEELKWQKEIIVELRQEIEMENFTTCFVVARSPLVQVATIWVFPRHLQLDTS